MIQPREKMNWRKQTLMVVISCVAVLLEHSLQFLSFSICQMNPARSG